MSNTCHICNATQLTDEEKQQIEARRATAVEDAKQREQHLASNLRTQADFERNAAQ